jgi:hypothetical protein
MDFLYTSLYRSIRAMKWNEECIGIDKPLDIAAVFVRCKLRDGTMIDV